jgi:hypothetical protein
MCSKNKKNCPSEFYMYIIVEIVWTVQKFCTRLVGMVLHTGHSKKVATATPTQSIVGIHMHCVSGNIPDQMENVMYCQVLEVLFNDTQLLR